MTIENQDTEKSKNGYGVDVAIRRADDLDRRLLDHIKRNKGVTVLDIGYWVWSWWAVFANGGGRSFGLRG